MSDHPPDEHELLDRLAEKASRGDRPAAADLLRGLQDTIFRFCLSRLRDEEAARDATQETAMRMLRSIRSFRGQSSVRTWSLGFALNVCREAIRKNKRLHAKVELELITDPATAQTAPPAETIELMQESIKRLTGRQKEAVLLRYYEGLSVAEAAQVMACAEGTVKATLWSALRRLREMLSPQLAENQATAEVPTNS